MRQGHDVHSAPIVVVAPFSPAGSEAPSLGAANKISSVIRILSRSGRDIILINSAHNATKFRRARTYNYDFGYGVGTTVIDLPTCPVRPLGKTMNLLQARSIARRVTERRPCLVWAYNGYAFESLLSLELHRKSATPVVLEIEDWPTARLRSGHPKPWIDRFWFGRALRAAALVTFVNENVMARAGKIHARSLLLPGIISPALSEGGTSRAPFSTRPYTLGYFGTLSEEKGCGVLLQLAEGMPPGWRLQVTGSGPLLNDFLSLAKAHPDKIRCAPNAGDAELYTLMRQADAIVNPHTPIDQMGNGVFPFKVLEAIATERLLLSTPLPSCGLDLDPSVVWFDGDVGSLCEALSSCHEQYQRRATEVRHMGELVRLRYSEEAVFNELRAALPAVFS